MTDIILGVLHMCIFPGGLFALAVGLLFKGLDRRVEARLQRRVGPPLIQPLLDIAKLLTKETLIPKTAVRSVFLAAPVVGFAGMAVCAAFIPVPGVFSGLYNMGDLLVLFYLLPIPAIAIMLGGSASSSPFGAMGFSREMLMMLAYETPLLMILLAVAMLVGKATGTGAEFSLLAIVDWQQNAGSLGLNPVMIPALLAYLIFLPGTMGVPPFDIPEAETEVLEGPLLEYGGPLLALFQIGSALKTFVVLGLGVALFFPGTISDFWIVNLIWFVFKCLVLMLLSLTLVKSATGRFRPGVPLLCEGPHRPGSGEPGAGVGAVRRSGMSLDNMLKKLSVRSPWLFRINAGSCNGCDVELATTACIPRYDVERLGCRYCGSPRHADIVLITGPLTTRVRDRVLAVWNEIPEPKITVAVGICPISGGVFREGYSIEGPISRYIPVDVNVPGCPPRPQAILEGVVLARKMWLKKLGIEE